MRPWLKLKSILGMSHKNCPKCRLRLQRTGEPPGNQAERIVSEVMGQRTSCEIHWLENRLMEKLYAEETKNPWSGDAGFWGPALFDAEALQIVSKICPAFASFKEEDVTHLRDKKAPA